MRRRGSYSNTVARMAAQYETLLGSIVSRPGATIRELEIRTEAEREQALQEERARQDAQRRRLQGARRRVMPVANGTQSQDVRPKAGVRRP